MADLSMAILIGRLTRDAELKYLPTGTPLCSFSIATSTRKKSGDQWTDVPSFWNVELWGKQGESLNQYLSKGKHVAVEGTMRQESWEKDGQKHSKTVVNANSVQLLGGGQDVRNTASNPDRPVERQSPYNPDGSMRAQAAPSEEFTDDFPPF